MAKIPNEIVVDVRGVPELVASTRAALADLLRERADAEGDPIFSRKLREIAAEFEVGLGGS